MNSKQSGRPGSNGGTGLADGAAALACLLPCILLLAAIQAAASWSMLCQRLQDRRGYAVRAEPA